MKGLTRYTSEVPLTPEQFYAIGVAVDAELAKGARTVKAIVHVGHNDVKVGGIPFENAQTICSSVHIEAVMRGDSGLPFLALTQE